MTENPTPAAEPAQQPAQQAAPRRTLRDRLPSGRRAIAAGAVVAGLAVGGAGFGAGYAVADAGSSDTVTQTTDDGWGERGMPGEGRGPLDQLPGGGQPGGATGELPDFDGDGQPDSDGSTGTESSSDSSTLAG